MIMDHQLKFFLKFPGIHSGHDDDMEKVQMSLLTSLLKKNIKADPTETMKFTYQKTLEELPDVPVPSFSRIKSTFYRVRAEELPHSAEESGGNKINPPMEKYQNWKKIIPEKRQKFWPSCFLDGQNAGSFIKQQNYFVRWNFQVRSETFSTAFYYIWR